MSLDTSKYFHPQGIGELCMRAHTLAEIGKTWTTTLIFSVSVVDRVISAMLEIANFKERANHGRITRTQRISDFWQPKSGSIFN